MTSSDGLGFQEDMLQRASYEEPQPQFYYRQVKRAWQLNPEQLTTLQKLCEWREQTARKLDTPRNRVIWDEHLFAFCASACFERIDAEQIFACCGGAPIWTESYRGTSAGSSI